MKKKTIGFFSGGSDNEYNGKVIEGLQNACVDNNIDILGFTSLMNKQPAWFGEILSDSVRDGENRVFDLADYSMLDGVIILGDLFIDHDIQNELARRAREHNIPTVIIDGQYDGCYSILFNDSCGMEDITRHVIEHHKPKHINFISGYEDNRQSEERLEAFKGILKEYGIPFEKDRVGYGRFGGGTTEAIDNFLKSDLEFPDAIICANDMMAIEAVTYLAGLGYSVPEQIIVTGFDGIMQGQTFFPALTTVRRAIYESGEEAVKLLMRIWNGDKTEYINYLKSVIVKNQSCGCKATSRIDVSEYFTTQNEMVDSYKRFNYDLVNLTNEISKVTCIEDIFYSLIKNAYLFNVKDMYFCLNDKLVKSLDEITIEGQSDDLSQYTEVMNAYFFDENNKVVTERFPLWQLAPNNCINNSRRFMYFSPLYFQKRTLGYVAIKSDKYDTYSMLCYTLIRTISNAIGDFCMKKEMEAVVNKLEYMSVRDPMTALLNRRGLMSDGERIINESKDSPGYIMGIGIDLDGLKNINDSYGHEEGDNAIIQVAKAIMYARSGTELCSRTGGDEFFIFGHVVDKEMANFTVDRIHMFLEDYNSTSGKPYIVDCSCGLYIAPADKVQTFESVMKFADQIMYTVKANKKALK